MLSAAQHALECRLGALPLTLLQGHACIDLTATVTAWPLILKSRAIDATACMELASGQPLAAA